MSAGVRVPVAHVSMQFSDSAQQKRSDAERIFERQERRGAWWVTGTEAGEDELRAALAGAAKRHGYRFHVARSNWVAVALDRIERRSWRAGVEVFVESFEGRGQHSDRGVTWASFREEHVGRLTIGSGHYLTKGRPGAPFSPNVDENRTIARGLGEWAERHGAGKGLVFYAGDQNIVDRTHDTFFGEPLTSSWDELGKWENTGHGNIDVLASFDRDGRVKARRVAALDDSEFALATDHFLVEGVFDVKAVR